MTGLSSWGLSVLPRISVASFFPSQPHPTTCTRHSPSMAGQWREDRDRAVQEPDPEWTRWRGQMPLRSYGA